MAIEHHYQTPTSATTQTDTTLTTVRLGDSGFAEDGQLGAVASGSVDVEDSGHTLTLLPWQRWYSLETAGPSELTLTGTVAKDASSLTVTGTSTAFLTELSAGDELVVPGGGGTDYLWVESVSDDTHALVYYVPAYTATGQTATRAAQQRLFTGWTAPDIDQSGGEAVPGGGEFVGSGSIWNLNLADCNTALHFRMCRGAAFAKAGAVGSATTVGARLTALLATTEAALIHDDGLVTYSSTAIDAEDLTGRYLDEILNALSQSDRRNHSLLYHEATGQLELLFALPSTNVRASPALISNDDTDTGSLVFRTIGRAKRTLQGDVVAAGVQVTAARQNVYVSDATTAQIYEYRDISAPDSSLKTSATATAYGNQLLADAAAPDEKIICSVKVPASQVHLFGRLRCLQVKFLHLTGWDTQRWAQILHRDLAHYVDGEHQSYDSYKVDLVLGPVAPPPVPTQSLARIDYGMQDHNPATGATSAILQYAADGDNPRAGWTTEPKYGLMTYDATGLAGAQVPGVPKWTGIKMLGGGTVSIYCGISWNFVTSVETITLELLKNGVSIATTSMSQSGGSSFVNNILLNPTGVAVTNGDIITAKFSWTVVPAIGIIPAAGTWSYNNWLRITGSLT